ncbi:unnamed protein product [Pleuronectes platessa]|uniref:Uncharacterized protein n=1 Tax=Pleuronectes platessa TaxID=8262 RepID=A0A9N7TRP1_PLEPL|nr:unnamed protein product [Pleuronectes platessa]
MEEVKWTRVFSLLLHAPRARPLRRRLRNHLPDFHSFCCVHCERTEGSLKSNSAKPRGRVTVDIRWEGLTDSIPVPRASVTLFNNESEAVVTHGEKGPGKKKKENTSRPGGDSFGTAGGSPGYHSLLAGGVRGAEWPGK